jgi:hypothetical protein
MKTNEDINVVSAVTRLIASLMGLMSLMFLIVGQWKGVGDLEIFQLTFGGMTMVTAIAYSLVSRQHKGKSKFFRILDPLSAVIWLFIALENFAMVAWPLR